LHGPHDIPAATATIVQKFLQWTIVNKSKLHPNMVTAPSSLVMLAASLELHS